MLQLTQRGSTLALAYAQTHPGRVQALILRGIFLFRRKEIDFFWRSGTRCELSILIRDTHTDAQGCGRQNGKPPSHSELLALM
jgi:pimeloyl-ACP methyl ester carboxylesterase